MKNRINALSFLSLMTLITFLIFSCAKEEIIPAFESNKTISKQAIIQSVESADDLLPDISADMEDFPDLKFSSLEEAKQSLKIEEKTSWGIDIKGFACFRYGESLVVYNPNSPNLDFYDSRRYVVYWFKDNRPILSKSTTRLECVCRGVYTAIVLHRRTQTAVGIASYKGSACFVQNPQTDFNSDQ